MHRTLDGPICAIPRQSRFPVRCSRLFSHLPEGRGHRYRHKEVMIGAELGPTLVSELGIRDPNLAP